MWWVEEVGEKDVKVCLGRNDFETREGGEICSGVVEQLHVPSHSVGARSVQRYAISNRVNTRSGKQ